MKTIKQHLNDLPEPYRTQALENMLPGEADAEVEYRSDAVICGIYWAETPQGTSYWNAFYIKLLNQEDTP